MEQLKFSIEIDAPRVRVWRALWSDTSYSDWTSVFSPGSHAMTNWREGSRVKFVDGEGSGMESVIEKSVPNEFMSFKHLAEIQEGKVRPFKSKEWSGSHENYRLTERNGATMLTVDLETPEEYTDMFSDKFPKALERLKEIAESEKVPR